MDQLLLHILGDYFLQSDYLALNKSKDTKICLIHCLLYTLPFFILTHNILSLLIIFCTHFLFDRYSLVKYIIWLKNHMTPTFTYYPLKDCMFGYYDDFNQDNVGKEGCRPKFITIWLYIISDNAIHLACNYFALSSMFQ